MLRSLLAAVPLIALASCASHDAVFGTNLAPGFVPVHHTVSVLGVFKDGRMSSEAWDAIAPRVAHALGSGKCEAAYVDSGLSPNHALWSAVDEYTQANGPTDDLLAKVAPAAQGDLVLVVIVAGKLPVKDQIKVQDEGASRGPGQTMGGGRAGTGTLGGMRNGGGRMFRTDAVPVDRLDLSASFFSVPKASSVAMVNLEYSGESIDDAVTKFSNQVATTLPGATCVGWNVDSAKVDADAIRASIDR